MTIHFLAVGAVIWLFACLLRLLRSPLRSIPGPFLARFTDAIYVYRVWKQQFHVENLELHEKYGPIVRYGPNRYSFQDPEASKTIYSTGPQFKKSPWYRTWALPGSPNTFAEENIKAHAQQRKAYQSTYSMTSLVSYEAYVDECSELFDQRLREIARVGLPVDLAHWLQCYAFDAIGLITYGKRFGFLDRGDDVGGIMAVLDGVEEYGTLVGVYSAVHKYLFLLLNWISGPGNSGLAALEGFASARINEHLDKRKGRDGDRESSRVEPFLSKFFRKHEENPEEFSSSLISTGCFMNVGAGAGTTALSLSAALYYLLRNPACLEKLRREAAGRPSGRITFKQAQEMPYLQAVIKEALRLHPATGLPLERVVPPGGATISGHFFPEGTIVGVNTWVEHRDRRVWGENAEEFRPERWLTDDVERLGVMNRHWIPFGAGARACLGRNISLLEMTKLLPLLVRDFDFELVGGQEKDWKCTNAWFVKPRDFTVRIFANAD